MNTQESTPTYLQSARFTMETRTRARALPDGGGVVEYRTRHGRIALYPIKENPTCISAYGALIAAGVEYDLSIPRAVFEGMGFPKVLTVTFQRGDRLNDEGVA